MHVPTMRVVAVALLCAYTLSVAVAVPTARAGASRFDWAVHTDDRGAYDVKRAATLPKDGWKVTGWGSYDDTIEKTGWASLHIKTHADMEPQVQAYSAGYLEGYVTAPRIAQHLHNNFVNEWGGKAYPPALVTFVDANLAWMNAQIVSPPAGEEKYWATVALTLEQVRGIADGYARALPSLPAGSRKAQFFDFFMLNSNGDLEDILPVVEPSRAVAWEELSEDALHELLNFRGHCSSLVKLTADHAELFASHATWSSYTSMLRCFKRYELPFLTTGQSTGFSSYFGYVVSNDDWYVLDNGMVITETTNGVMNQTLFKQIVPQKTFEWLRVMVSNRVATSGAEWSRTFSLHSSGTYNNQWILVDTSRFTAGEAPAAGTLTILEQIPGYIEWADKTDVLVSTGYWASYNTPYFEKVFDLSGYPAYVDKYGDWFTHDHTPRANIFRRDQAAITTLDDMRRVIRYNDFQNDPLSRSSGMSTGDAENAISARSDLNPAGKYPIDALGHRCHGATDAKVTSKSLVDAGLITTAISSPTYDQQAPFRWSTSDYASLAHVGMPDLWQFPWVDFGWSEPQRK